MVMIQQYACYSHLEKKIPIIDNSFTLETPVMINKNFIQVVWALPTQEKVLICQVLISLFPLSMLDFILVKCESR